MSLEETLTDLETARTLLAAYNSAILALLTGNVQEYTLDTGQTTQTVKRPDLGKLQGARDALRNEIVTLQARAGRGSTVVVHS